MYEIMRLAKSASTSKIGQGTSKDRSDLNTTSLVTALVNSMVENPLAWYDLCDTQGGTGAPCSSQKSQSYKSFIADNPDDVVSLELRTRGTHHRISNYAGYPYHSS